MHPLEAVNKRVHRISPLLQIDNKFYFLTAHKKTRRQVGAQRREGSGWVNGRVRKVVAGAGLEPATFGL